MESLKPKFTPPDLPITDQFVIWVRYKKNFPRDLDAVKKLVDSLAANLTNCFAEGGRLTGIVDWSDAIYGDWLYDIARLRMNLEQLSDETSLNYYRNKVRESGNEPLEQVYYVCRLIEYLAIYNKYGKEYGVRNNQKLLLAAH